MAFTAFVAFIRHLGCPLSVAFRVFCNVYGALGWDPCGIGVGRLWCFSAFVVFRLVFLFIFCGVALFVAFMGHWGGAPCGVHSVCRFMRRLGCSLFVAFRAFVTFIGHWGGTLVAFTVLYCVWSVGVGRLWLPQHL